MRLNYDCVRDVLLKLEELLLVEYHEESDSFGFNRVSIKQIFKATPHNCEVIENMI